MMYRNHIHVIIYHLLGADIASTLAHGRLKYKPVSINNIISICLYPNTSIKGWNLENFCDNIIAFGVVKIDI